MHFLAADIERITDVKRNRLEQWLELGFILPSIQQASGHGSRNIWSRADLYTIAVFKKITESGLSRKVVASFLATGMINEEKADDTAYLLFTRRGDKAGGVQLMYEGTEDLTIDLEDVQRHLDLAPFDDAYIINFAKIKAEVDARIGSK